MLHFVSKFLFLLTNIRLAGKKLASDKHTSLVSDNEKRLYEIAIYLCFNKNLLGSLKCKNAYNINISITL